MKPMPTSPKPYLLFWLAVPVLLVWLAASYLLGVARQPIWQDRDTQTGGQVLAIQNQLVQSKDASSSANFSWHQTGLVTFWFDDGWLTQYTIAAPILQEFNYPAAVAITTQYIGYEAYMSWGQVKRLYHYYQWQITAHGRTHNCDINSFTSDIIRSEITGSYQDLLAQAIDVDTYVLPCGVKTDDIINQVKQTYVALRDSGSVHNPLPVTDTYTLHAYTVHDNTPLNHIQNWLNQAKKDKSWLILMFHQLDDKGGEYSLKPGTFKQIVQVIHESQLPVVIPATALSIYSTQP